MTIQITLKTPNIREMQRLLQTLNTPNEDDSLKTLIAHAARGPHASVHTSEPETPHIIGAIWYTSDYGAAGNIITTDGTPPAPDAIRYADVWSTGAIEYNLAAQLSLIPTDIADWALRGKHWTLVYQLPVNGVPELEWVAADEEREYRTGVYVFAYPLWTVHSEHSPGTTCSLERLQEILAINGQQGVGSTHDQSPSPLPDT